MALISLNSMLNFVLWDFLKLSSTKGFMIISSWIVIQVNQKLKILANQWNFCHIIKEAYPRRSRKRTSIHILVILSKTCSHFHDHHGEQATLENINDWNDVKI